MDTYPIPNPEFELHLTATDCTLFHIVKADGLSKRRLGAGSYSHWKLPRTHASYMAKCDGKKSHQEICSALNLPFAFLGDRIAEYLEDGVGAISMSETPDPCAPGLHLTGSFDSYAPLHMSVEITDTCNFFCDHCYVSASPWKHARGDYQTTVDLMTTMWNHGVKVVEITGGECTTHPDFLRILEFAANRFHLVAIISNGYLLGTRDGLADHVASFDNTCVQISIDGMRDFHDKFRQKPGSFDAATEAVRRLKRRGVLVRIAMSVTPDNVDQVEPVFLHARELGVDAFTPASITSFGRASELGMCAEKDHELQHAVADRLKNYAQDDLFNANRLAVETSKRNKEINCGAGWRTFAMNGATGEVRSCLFLADSKKFGSLHRDDYAEVFKNPYMAMFQAAPSPSPELDTCKSCHYVSECNGCFAKAFRVSESDYPECPWRHQYFPGMTLSPLAGASSIVPISMLTQHSPEPARLA
jgi:radical SAM protein with 4Fe4S-binding SPASM domain